MSALGDYIHYYKRNYFSYGTGKTAGKRTYNKTKVGDVIKAKRKAMSSAFHIKQADQFKERYEEALNFLYKAGTKDPKVLEDKEDRALIEEFYQIVQQKLPGVIYDAATMAATHIPKGVGKMHKLREDKYTISFGTLAKRLRQFHIFFTKNIRELRAQYSRKEIQQKRELFLKVSNEIKNFYVEATVLANEPNSSYVTMKRPRITAGYGMNMAKATAEQRNAIDEINQLIVFFNGRTKAQVHGILGELSGAMAGAKMAGVSAKELKQYLMDHIVGGKGSQATYKKVNFSSEFVNIEKLATTGWSYSSRSGNVTMNKPTQDKIDVIIKTKTDPLTPVSVKNYNFKAGSAEISLVSGISLLSLIQNENQGDFVNHYLNITASREEEKGETLADLSDFREQMHDVMKELILVKALTGLNIQKTMAGSGTGPKAADYIVVNDNSDATQPFKVFSMAEVLNFSSLDNRTGLAKYASIDGYDDPIWKNEGENAKARITDLMLQMHQKKLHAFATAQAFIDLASTAK